MFRKTEVIKFNDFMSGNYKVNRLDIDKKKAIKAGVAVSVTLLSLTFGDVSFAAAGTVNGIVTEKVVNAFDPLVQLAQALSYPVGLVMMLGGGLFMMIGNADKGLSMIQKAGFGYILVQMLPMFMDLLVEIAKSI